MEKANYVVTHHSGGRDLQHPPLVAFQDEGDDLGKKSRELARAFGTKYLTRWTCTTLYGTEYSTDLSKTLVQVQPPGRARGGGARWGLFVS